MTPASRSERVSSTEPICSCKSVKLTASTATTASESSIRSPNWVSPSSPIGVERLIGSRPYFWTSTTFSGVCLLYTSDAADEEDSVDLGGRRIIKKKKLHVYA